ncbi:hypothetical protein ACPA5B_13415 [Pseudomonas solani]|uniref:hypothetical protein n=1 Tax=Pseudomonas solani TaxID=2731552 RepID=UPI003C2C6DCB
MSIPTNVPEPVKLDALAAVQQHPLYQEASAWTYCESDVFYAAKSFVKKVPIPLPLVDTESVLMVIYWTSARKPEPLSGFGKTYSFVLHPETLAILFSSVDTWRS